MRHCILALFFAAFACGVTRPAVGCTLEYKFSLDREQVVPPSSSAGSGVADLWYCTQGLQGIISLNQTDVVTAVHIHGPAALGENGPVLFNLPLPMGSSVHLEGIYLSLEAQRLLWTSAAYVDVHTVAHPDGAIRGAFRVKTTGVTSSPWTAVKKLYR